MKKMKFLLSIFKRHTDSIRTPLNQTIPLSYTKDDLLYTPFGLMLVFYIIPKIFKIRCNIKILDIKKPPFGAVCIMLLMIPYRVLRSPVMSAFS